MAGKKNWGGRQKIFLPMISIGPPTGASDEGGLYITDTCNKFLNDQFACEIFRLISKGWRNGIMLFLKLVRKKMKPVSALASRLRVLQILFPRKRAREGPFAATNYAPVALKLFVNNNNSSAPFHLFVG